MSKKYWDDTVKIYCTEISPGEIFITDECESAVTTVGSNIAVCIRDSESGIGGMSNFLLPSSDTTAYTESKHRFSYYMLDTMVKTIKGLSNNKTKLEAKLFGGSKIDDGTTDNALANIDFISQYLEKKSIPLIRKSIGGHHARKVYFIPANGNVEMKKLSADQKDIFKQEVRYRNRIKKAKVG